MIKIVLTQATYASRRFIRGPDSGPPQLLTPLSNNQQLYTIIHCRGIWF
jgi:hypothetical protein